MRSKEREKMLTVDDYRNAPSGVGPLALEWKDKPHRLVYDLCNRVEQLIEALRMIQSMTECSDEQVAGLAREAIKYS